MVEIPRKFNEWRERLDDELNPARVIDLATRIYEGARWNSTDRLRTMGAELCGEMLASGFDEAEVIEVPADGKTHYGGWCMPLEWSPKSAELVITTASGEVLCRADYRECPHCLVLFSAATPAEGLHGELVFLPGEPTDAELADAAGQFVLLETAPSIEFSRKMRNAGVHGWITDFVSRIEHVKEGPELEDAVPYLNYSIAPWDIPDGERAIGFAVSPRQGRRLREALAGGGKLSARALVDLEMGPGTTPVICGSVNGKSGKCAILTAHIDEPGGVDNASGPAMILELVRAITTLKKGDGEPLAHGIRVFFGVEVRGLQGLVNTQPELFEDGLFGLNLDMIGTDPLESRCPILAVPAIPGCPDFVFPVLASMLDFLSNEEKAFRWNSCLMVDDNHPCDPAFKVPTPVFVQGPDATYHTNLDTPARLDPRWVRKLGAAIGGIIAGLTDANRETVEALLHLNFKHSVRCLERSASRFGKENPANARQQLKYLVARECRRLRSTLRLDQTASPPVPFVRDYQPSDPVLVADNNDKAMLRSVTIRLEGALIDSGEELLKPFPSCHRAGMDPAHRFVPVKAFKGPFAIDNLPAEQESRIVEAAGPMTWCGPNWLQAALGLSDGTRSVEEIHNAVLAEGMELELPVLLRTFEALEACSFVCRLPFIEAKDLEVALRHVGLRKGMLIVLHSGLSRFGYISGGADTLLDSLLSVIGDDGTLCTPTHSLCWAGELPYDPLHSPSRVGTVTEVFRQRPGVLRSEHPTHSVAAVGPLAATLVAGHDPTCAPIGREGFWGHFVDHDGWVLLLSSRRSNTVMHAAEIWGGLRAPDVYLPAESGASPPILSMIPWHVEWFDDIYAVLDSRGSIRKAKLGHGEIELMRSREIVEIGLELIREDPMRVLPDNCPCSWCAAVRELEGDERSIDPNH